MAVDATGKVKGAGTSVLEDAVTISRNTQASSKAAKESTATGDGTSVLDRVNVQIANTLTAELDPEKCSARRPGSPAFPPGS